jgi:hypothetical protein
MDCEKEEGFINSAIDFFANIGAGEKLEVDNDSGIYSPAAMHEVTETISFTPAIIQALYIYLIILASFFA